MKENVYIMFMGRHQEKIYLKYFYLVSLIEIENWSFSSLEGKLSDIHHNRISGRLMIIIVFWWGTSSWLDIVDNENYEDEEQGHKFAHNAFEWLADPTTVKSRLVWVS